MRNTYNIIPEICMVAHSKFTW